MRIHRGPHSQGRRKAEVSSLFKSYGTPDAVYPRNKHGRGRGTRILRSEPAMFHPHEPSKARGDETARGQ